MENRCLKEILVDRINTMTWKGRRRLLPLYILNDGYKKYFLCGTCRTLSGSSQYAVWNLQYQHCLELGDIDSRLSLRSTSSEALAWTQLILATEGSDTHNWGLPKRRTWGDERQYKQSRTPYSTEALTLENKAMTKASSVEQVELIPRDPGCGRRNPERCKWWLKRKMANLHDRNHN